MTEAAANTDAEVPDPVTLREVREIVRAFSDSGWRSMSLELRGLRIVLGKDGRPGGAPDAGPPGRSGNPGARTGDVRDQAHIDPECAGSGTSPGDDRAGPAHPTRGAPAGGTAAAGGGGAPAGSAAVTPPASTATAEADPEGCIAVRSPAIGSFWVAPSPGQPPFVRVGDTVDEDQQLAVVEVMKLMNPVLAATAGEVVRVCAANAEMVEYDQVLFWVRPG